VTQLLYCLNYAGCKDHEHDCCSNQDCTYCLNYAGCKVHGRTVIWQNVTSSIALTMRDVKVTKLSIASIICPSIALTMRDVKTLSTYIIYNVILCIALTMRDVK